MSDQFFWYVTRSSALMSWVFAALSILLGLMTSSRLLGRRPTIPWLVDFHRLLARMSVSFLLLHMASLWFDSFVRFRFADLLIPWFATVPGLSRTSIALGVIAAWLLAAVQVTSLLKDRISERTWRATHQLSFLTLILGVFHALQAGSDVSNPIVFAIGASLLTAITFLGLLRLFRLAQTERRSDAAPVGEPEPEPYDPKPASAPTYRRVDPDQGGPDDWLAPQPELRPQPRTPAPPPTGRPPGPEHRAGPPAGQRPLTRSMPAGTRPASAPRPTRPEHRG